METMKKPIPMVLAFLMVTTGFPVAAVDQIWYEPDWDEAWEEILPPNPVFVGGEWPDVDYVQAGFFEHVDTDWGGYYSRLDSAEVELPADSLRIQYIADMSKPFDAEIGFVEQWDYEDAQCGTANGLATLTSRYRRGYIHLAAVSGRILRGFYRSELGSVSGEHERRHAGSEGR